MKKITKIQLKNYRAYYGKYAAISLVKGENVLIYGENGSGKTSLFRAINDFFNASTSLPDDRLHSFTKNEFQSTSTEGYIVIKQHYVLA